MTCCLPKNLETQPVSVESILRMLELDLSSVIHNITYHTSCVVYPICSIQLKRISELKTKEKIKFRSPSLMSTGDYSYKVILKYIIFKESHIFVIGKACLQCDKLQILCA